MSKSLRVASGVAVTAMFLTIIATAEPSDAETLPARQAYEAPAASALISVPQPELGTPPTPPAAAPAPPSDPMDAAPTAADSLPELVSATPTPQSLSSELDCLAGAIYFEAKGETLPGQLAVGRVIVARAKSGRFPASYCGVVYQRSQFSFVRGRSMPAIDKSGRAWSEAARIARIAHEGSWKSPVEGALYFHAARVSPGWRLTRLARVDNHVFYR